MPAKKSCMLIRMAQVPPLSRTTPGRLVKPMEHLLKKMLSKPSPKLSSPFCKIPHTYISSLFTVLFFLQQHHHGAISFSYGDLLLANPWAKIPFPSGQFHEGCHTCRSWRRPRPGFRRSFQRWKHEVTGDLFPIPSYSPASPIVMSIPNLRSAAMISHQGMIILSEIRKDFNGWIRNRSATSPPSSPSAQPQLLRSMEECTVFLQCLIHINNPVNQNLLPLTSQSRIQKDTKFQEFLGLFWADFYLLTKLS